MDDTRQEALFRVVPNVGTEAVYGAMVVTLGAPYHFRFGQGRLKGLEDMCDTQMEDLVTTVVKFSILHVCLGTYMTINICR